MAKQEYVATYKFSQNDLQSIADILNASRKLALSIEEGYLRPELPFTFTLSDDGKSIDVIPEKDTSIESAKKQAKIFFDEVITARTQGILTFTFDTDNKSSNLVTQGVLLKDHYFPSFKEVEKFCFPQQALRMLEPNQSRLKQLAVLDHYHQQKSAIPYDSFIFSDEKLFLEKLEMLAKGPDIELLLYVVTGDTVAHSQPIKFQKKGGKCSFVILDSKGPTPASPPDLSANLIQQHFKELGLPKPHILINQEGRQGPTVDCWVFALNDGKRMGRESDLYEKLISHYPGKTSQTGHATFTIPPEYYTMTQSLSDKDIVELQGLKAYSKYHPEYDKKNIHHKVDEETKDLRTETYLTNIARHTADDINKKTEKRSQKYQKLLKNKTFMSDRNEDKIIHDHNGALITPTRLVDIATRQEAIKSKGIPIADPQHLRLDDPVGDQNTVLILDAVKSISKSHDKKHRLERTPINLELTMLKKQWGFDITYGQLLDAIQNNMETQKFNYKGGALGLLKDALTEVRKHNPERWRDFLKQKDSYSSSEQSQHYR